ncbi:NADH:flavin oxidoreductase/NADH oxidase [Stereum hirsutum FP-91666 SS1]|uniref:NADH:flavin oxidoreductase/NADH oxidase n=1 Tax=Stereum hirsutum (strain FP-91666) TaxID=721885 RepID=UPI000440A89E|nr:NADH:flavin oxidoreductase/NADH oxidase [Stereum hirsutum FP-91666 SS1]EIM88581.1 NADH:flavin oxidoreductase/NADH oxidase [Stereum hirsutum FP-91666 SS1]
MEFKLFKPIQLGDITLQHRIVLAPCTRLRNSPEGAPLDITVQYYEQRATVPGTFLISEGTSVAAKAVGFPNVPGIFNDVQIKAWKKLVDAVHAKGSFIYLQLAAAGSLALPDVLSAQGLPYVGAGTVPFPGREATPPRALTIDEIKEYVQFWATAAKNAVEGAGFDGVEVHGANGLLIHQFLRSASNNRTDEYGGSAEGRSKFALEVVEAVVKAVGQNKVGFRISPWLQSNNASEEITSTFTYLITRIRDLYPALSYLHVVEPRVERDSTLDVAPKENNDFLRKIWGSEAYIAAGGFGREDAIQTVEEKGGLVALGRHFIANPDLPRRFREKLPLNKYDRPTFYVPGDVAAGYIDYPFYDEAKEKDEQLVSAEAIPVA